MKEDVGNGQGVTDNFFFKKKEIGNDEIGQQGRESKNGHSEYQPPRANIINANENSVMQKNRVRLAQV
ncbi:MAG: hypothetical protein HW383_446 [Candidatus Magasanikbacteria bacterium]|nr:hypothetical protein [Candidatus Magasanikbacteria bacterium]